MPLTQKQKRALKQLAHAKKPVVTVGSNGLTDTVMNEIDVSLAHHELLKVKLAVGDKDDRQVIVDAISEQLNTECVQTIGHVAVFYRAADKPIIVLPKN